MERHLTTPWHTVRCPVSQEQKVMVRYGHKVNAKVWEMYMYTSSHPALSYHYKIQHLSLILLAKLLLFFFPFFSLLSSIFLARISLIRSKNTCYKHKTEELSVLFVQYQQTNLARKLICPGKPLIRRSNIPCQHWHGFWQKSPHSTRPTAQHVPSPRLRWPAVGRPGLICFRPGERARSRPPSLAESALCKTGNVIQPWIMQTGNDCCLK